MKRTPSRDILLNPVLLGVYTVILIVGLASIDEVPRWFAIFDTNRSRVVQLYSVYILLGK